MLCHGSKGLGSWVACGDEGAHDDYDTDDGGIGDDDDEEEEMTTTSVTRILVMMMIMMMMMMLRVKPLGPSFLSTSVVFPLGLSSSE